MPRLVAPAAAAAPHAIVELVPLTRIIESPTNPRKTFTDIEDLAEDLKKRGVLQPILCRPAASPEGMNGNLLELVFGARRFRAAKLAGLEAIPAMVRELGATEALEIQIVENSKRQDVHPMEEAEGFEALRQSGEAEYSVDELAAKVGKSTGYVYGRMKLLSLCKEARAAFYKGRFTASSALLVARIPDHGVQRLVLKDLSGRGGDDEAWGSHEVSWAVRNHMLRLSEAPFSKDDATLAPGAGPCKTCPKRSGAQPELFADVSKQDGELCTDPSCYRAKADETWSRRASAQKAKGLEVLEGKAAKKACSYASEYVKLDENCSRDPKYRPWKTLVGKVAKDQVVLARDAQGNVHELVPKAATAKLLKAAGHDFKVERSPSRARSSSVEVKASRALEDAVSKRMVAKLLEACRRSVNDAGTWYLAAAEIDQTDDGVLDDLYPPPEKEDYTAKLRRHREILAKLDSTELRALALTMVLSVHLRYGELRDQIRELAGINEKQLTAEVKAELAAKAKAPAAEPAKPTKKKGARRG
jgi:ParB/RepB/Spo0J family partition protein